MHICLKQTNDMQVMLEIKQPDEYTKEYTLVFTTIVEDKYNGKSLPPRSMRFTLAEDDMVYLANNLVGVLPVGWPLWNEE